MADWSRLSRHLVRVEDTATFTWDELADVVGGLPPSAAKHRPWWSGDRPHVRAWQSQGFRVAGLDMGNRVSFQRVGRHHPGAIQVPTELKEKQSPEHTRTPAAGGSDIVLVSCVKTKQRVPAAAKDLYISPLFVKERRYAEHVGAPWFILSAEHGLVAPDGWLAPCERYLPDTSASYRAAWGAWVAARLELLAGPCRGQRIEIHASSAYVDALRGHLEALGAVVFEPLHGLTHGHRLAWYDKQGSAEPVPSVDPRSDPAVDVSAIVACLLDEDSTMSPSDFLSTRGSELDRPGLYCWWVDEDGAAALTAGLGIPVKAGLIYAGSAGATRWPSGGRSSNTLWGRITTMHLGGNHEFSTFRRTLASIVAAVRTSASVVDEAVLTAWMHQHLRLVTVPYDDADTLGQLEGAVLDVLDPPLNLQGRPPTPLRRRLSELRKPVSKG